MKIAAIVLSLMMAAIIVVAGCGDKQSVDVNVDISNSQSIGSSSTTASDSDINQVVKAYFDASLDCDINKGLSYLTPELGSLTTEGMAEVQAECETAKTNDEFMPNCEDDEATALEMFGASCAQLRAMSCEDVTELMMTAFCKQLYSAVDVTYTYGKATITGDTAIMDVQAQAIMDPVALGIDPADAGDTVQEQDVVVSLKKQNGAWKISNIVGGGVDALQLGQVG